MDRHRAVDSRSMPGSQRQRDASKRLRQQESRRPGEAAPHARGPVRAGRGAGPTLHHERIRAAEVGRAAERGGGRPNGKRQRAAPPSGVPEAARNRAE